MTEVDEITNFGNKGVFEKRTFLKLVLISLAAGLFVVYLNFAFLKFDMDKLGESKYLHIILFFIFRYLYFSGTIFLMLRYNLLQINVSQLGKRIFRTLLIGLVSYLIYIGFSKLLNPTKEWFTVFVLFQFVIMTFFCALSGHVSHLYFERRNKELEIEQLKTENLKSRYEALTNQINPHFFFNSLNGLASLIRKKNEDKSIEYVNKLSDVFRYVLQSDKKSIVTLCEELECLNALLYMMEVRFANKLVFHNLVTDEHKNLKIPVLSLLPLIDNVVVHNVIDSEHKMEVIISLNEEMELLVSNPIYPKLNTPNTNGTGLKNLENRFMLFMDRKIRIIDDGKTFTVCLPLIKDKNEDTNR